jgi:hypothetical protein
MFIKTMLKKVPYFFINLELWKEKLPSCLHIKIIYASCDSIKGDQIGALIDNITSYLWTSNNKSIL